MPADYSLWRLGLRMGIPPWVLEGYPLDRPPVEWIARVLDFHDIEQSITVKRAKR